MYFLFELFAPRYSDGTGADHQYVDVVGGFTSGHDRTVRDENEQADLAVPLLETPARRSGCELASDRERSPDQVPVVARGAEEDLGALRPLEVQVRRVLPREADTAVHLDVLSRSL